MKNTLTTGKGYFRKTKLGLSCGIVLVSALGVLATTSTVGAEETKPNPNSTATVNKSTSDADNRPTNESRAGVPKDLDTSVNEDFIKQFPYGERFKDEDGVPATRTKAPDIPLRFKPKDYEKTVTRKINYRVERTGATVSRIYQTIRYYGTYEFEKGTPEVLEITEAEVPVVNEKDIPETNTKEDFNGGVVPLDPPKLDMPEYKGTISDKGTPEVRYGKDFVGGTVPNKAPSLNKLDFNGTLPLNGTPEVLSKSEFKGGVVPMDAPKVDLPKLDVPKEEQPKVERPRLKQTKVKEQPKAEQLKETPKKEQLPYTGTSSLDTVVSAIGSLTGLLGLGYLALKRKN